MQIKKITTGILPSGYEIGNLRIGGQGLANLLWLWSKSVIFSELTGAQKIWPIWNQIKPKALIRGEF